MSDGEQTEEFAIAVSVKDAKLTAMIYSTGEILIPTGENAIGEQVIGEKWIRLDSGFGY